MHVDDELARERWQASAVASRLCYLTPHAPGSTVTQPPPQAGRSLDEWTGFENFAVVVFQVEAFDGLFLHSSGHRRVWADKLSAAWIAP